jgi:hypothetical protein
MIENEFLNLGKEFSGNGFFNQLVGDAERIQTQCTDYNVTNVNNNKAYYDPATNLLAFVEDGGGVHKLQLTPWSMSQLCGKLGVPANYVQKCIEAGNLELAGENVNDWLDDYNKNLFLRGYGSSIRGVLSDRYGVMDTPSILSVLGDTINFDDYTIKGAYLSPERLHLRVVQNRRMMITDDLFAGIQIDSSDVGRSTLLVRFMIYKQICTNGLCVSKGGGILFKQKHYAIDPDEFSQGLIVALNSVRPLVEQFAFKIKIASDKGIVLDEENQVQKFIEEVRAKTRLTEDAVGKVIDLMNTKYKRTQMGLIHSITEHAQDYSLERRLELESIAGDLLLVA